MKGKTPLLLLALLMMLGWAVGAPVTAQTPKPSEVYRRPTPAPPLRGGQTAVDPGLAQHSDVARGLDDVTPSQKVIQALQAMHMVDCAATVQRITDFLFEGQDANFVAQPLGPDNVRWPTVFAIESADPAGGHTRFALLMIAGNCSGMYEQTLYWPNPCPVVKASVFARYTDEHPLLRDFKASADGPAREVFLTPAGPGCISIQKELFH